MSWISSFVGRFSGDYHWPVLGDCRGGRKRAPNLHAAVRIIAGLCTLLMRPTRVLRSAIVFKACTLLHLHSALSKRQYRLLFSSKRRHRRGPKGPEKHLIDAVVAMK